jgi:hypothetical protein
MIADIAIRPAEPGDTAFVIATWLHHYKDESYFAKRIKHSIFFRWHHDIVERILARPGTNVAIACSAQDPEVVFGFLVYEQGEKPTLHFAFVKEELRRMGIGRALFGHENLDPCKCFFTHWTFMMNDIFDRFPGLTYDPYRI